MCDKNTLYSPISLFKRLIVIIYDILLLTALLFTVGIVVAAIITFAINQGNAITEEHTFYIASQLIILSVLICVSFIFYSWFWTHGGQTLGMRTWRVQLTSVDGSQIDVKKCAIRYMTAIISWTILGLGFFWSLFDKQNRTWHDILSGTQLVQLPKK